MMALFATIRRPFRQVWRNVLSIYYTNTLTWRWLKSGALVFLGFFAWMSSSVLLSVVPEWEFLTYPMAYGALVILWGPFTHLVIVPLTIRLRRNADNSATRWLSKNLGKLNIAVFLALVIVLGTLTPSFMMLGFSFEPGDGEGGNGGYSGELVCDAGADVVACHVENASGIGSVEVTSGGETLATVDEPPFEFELQRADLDEAPTGREFRVVYYDEDGSVLNRQIRTV